MCNCARLYAGGCLDISVAKPGTRGVRIDIEIPPALEKKLRAKAYERSGGKRGGLRDVVIEALEQFLEE